MKRAINYLLFIWPVPILAYLVFITLSSQANVADKLFEASDLIWGTGDKQIIIQVKQKSTGEQETFEIQLNAKNSQDNETFRLTINKDMFGGGFVKAVQADNDSEFEILAWGSHEERESFLLKYQEGDIKRTPFTETTKEIKNLAIEWHQAHVMNGMTLSVFVIFAVGYYVFIGIIWMTVKIIKKIR